MISGLDLRPQIRIHTRLKNPTYKKYWVMVENVGPVDALQLEVNLMHHTYIKESSVTKFKSGSSAKYVLSKLEPLQSKRFMIPEHYIYGDWNIKEPKEHNLLEIRVSYRRSPDLHRFLSSAFYFVHPDGMWVPENRGSLDQEIYAPIKQAAYTLLYKNDSKEDHGDILHPLRSNEE